MIEAAARCVSDVCLADPRVASVRVRIEKPGAVPGLRAAAVTMAARGRSGAMKGLPKKALVLAAGLGSRLRPLSESCPKPLLPLWGVPLLERMLRLLESWGVEEAAVNLHWQADRVRAYLAGRPGPLKIRVSHEP
jgi:MurNAc alpha-1-phosphate uridylyltransferase